MTDVLVSTAPGRGRVAAAPAPHGRAGPRVDGHGLRIGVLGPLELTVGNRVVPLPARNERAVLVALTARVGRPVAAVALADDVAAAGPESRQTQNVAVSISRLRRRLADALGPAGRRLIETVPSGYRLAIDPAQVDAVRFEELVVAGRCRFTAGAAEDACAELVAALDLWRGPALPEIGDSRCGQAAGVRLAELRDAALDMLHEAGLALGDHDLLVAQLEACVADDPYRERRWAQLMVALYRSGRQADALRAYQRARTVLADELGVEPGPELRALEAAVLAHDPALDRGASPAREAGPVAVAGPAFSPPPRSWIDRQREVPLAGWRPHWVDSSPTGRP